MDAARMENESGEPSIALMIGSQTEVKQMILTFPSPGIRVKRSSFTAYLTNTLFVLMGNANGMLARLRVSSR